MPAPARVVVAHAPEDAPLWKRLEKHLAGLLSREVIQTWSIAEVQGGRDWRKVIAEHLDSARFILLLLSADFMADHPLEGFDLRRAPAKVVAVRVRPFDWDAAPMDHVHVLPENGEPVSTWNDPEKGYAEVARAIRLLVTSPPARHAPHGTPHNLPPPRLFVGRRDELKLVDEALAREGRSSIAQAALWGLGGVGKTALALRYAYDSLDAGTYPGGIFWVVAEGRPLDIVARLAGILREYAPGLLPDIPERTSPAKVAEVVRRALEDLPAPSLLVLDNVTERWSAEMLPGRQARVLMTVRDRRLGVGKAVALDVLSYDDARELVIDLAEKVPEDKNEEDAFRRVLEKHLGGLAVAIEVAARAVREWARSWIEYEKLLATRPEDALDAPEDRSPNYEPGVFAALNLSIDRCGETARELLEAAAVFAPDAVPLDWTYATAGLDAENIQVKRALGELVALRLTKADSKDDTLSMHRLVRQQVRDRAKAQVWEAIGKRAVRQVGNWIGDAVGSAKEQMDAVEKRRGHIMEALAVAERVGHLYEWSFIADRLATHLQHRGEYGEARALFEQALSIVEKICGLWHPNVAALLSNLSAVLPMLGESASARPLAERALAISEYTYGAEHPNVAVCLSTLAGVLHDLGELDQALSLLQRARTIFEGTHGLDHPDVALNWSNLATILHAMGQPAQARPLAERALAFFEKAYGPQHPDVALRLLILGSVLQDLEETAQARPLLERALTILEKALPPSHPYVHRCRKRLGLVPETSRQPPSER